MKDVSPLVPGKDCIGLMPSSQYTAYRCARPHMHDGATVVLTEKVCHPNLKAAELWDLLDNMSGDDVTTSALCWEVDCLLEPACHA